MINLTAYVASVEIQVSLADLTLQRVALLEQFSQTEKSSPLIKTQQCSQTEFPVPSIKLQQFSQTDMLAVRNLNQQSSQTDKKITDSKTLQTDSKPFVSSSSQTNMFAYHKSQLEKRSPVALMLKKRNLLVKKLESNKNILNELVTEKEAIQTQLLSTKQMLMESIAEARDLGEKNKCLLSDLSEEKSYTSQLKIAFEGVKATQNSLESQLIEKSKKLAGLTLILSEVQQQNQDLNRELENEKNISGDLKAIIKESRSAIKMS